MNKFTYVMVLVLIMTLFNCVSRPQTMEQKVEYAVDYVLSDDDLDSFYIPAF